MRVQDASIHAEAAGWRDFMRGVASRKHATHSVVLGYPRVRGPGRGAEQLHRHTGVASHHVTHDCEATP
jgi:hypothetical protein